MDVVKINTEFFVMLSYNQASFSFRNLRFESLSSISQRRCGRAVMTMRQQPAKRSDAVVLVWFLLLARLVDVGNSGLAIMPYRMAIDLNIVKNIAINVATHLLPVANHELTCMLQLIVADQVAHVPVVRTTTFLLVLFR